MWFNFIKKILKNKKKKNINFRKNCNTFSNFDFKLLLLFLKYDYYFLWSSLNIYFFLMPIYNPFIIKIKSKNINNNNNIKIKFV